MPPNHWAAEIASIPFTWAMRSLYAMGNDIRRLAACRITIRFAASGARGGSSSFSSTVFSVQMRKSEVPMLITVSNVRRRFLRQFRTIRGMDFMRPGFPYGNEGGKEPQEVQKAQEK